MNVICIKPTKKLVKNATYRVASFSNDNNKKSPYFRPIIRIYLTDNVVTAFPLESFRPTDSTDFQQINWICPEYSQVLEEKQQMKIDATLKPGDYIIPLYDSLKTLIKGRKYKVKEVLVDKSQWGGVRIKLVGSERWYTSWHFRRCTNQEMREISLKNLFDESTDTEVVNRFKRKFDYLSDEEKKDILIKIFFQSYLDRYRNNSDVIDWSINKVGSTYNLKNEDFDIILDTSIRDIIEFLK